MVDYLKLFFADGVMGYFLQAIGYLLAILAFNKKIFKFSKFLLTASIFSILTFGIRSISAFSFGFHTILIMISFIIISVLILKMSVPQTVLAVLLTTVVTILAESINYGVLCLIFSKDTIDFYLKGGESLQGKFNKALIGIPTNIILVTAMAFLYKIRMKKVKKEAGKYNGESSTQNS